MTEAQRPAIGFAGLGLMGAAMVERLQACGYPMTVIAHRNRAPIEAAIARGADEAETPRALAAASDIVMLCVDTSDAVEAVMLGENGVMEGIRPDALVIDFGTSLPASTRMIGERLAGSGAAMLDAPLGRTPAHARQGKLNIMAAGAPDDFARARPVLDDLGENVFHVGPLGAGHTLKIINNFFAMTMACALSEAFAMSERAGLKRQTLYEVMASGPLHSGMMDFIKANAIDRDPSVLAFAIANARKDVGYYFRMAESLGVTSRMSPAARDALQDAIDAGWGDRYVPEMVDYFDGLFAGRPDGG